MLLAQQVQAILYHFLMGWIYGCTFSFLCSLTVSIRLPLLKSCLEIIYHICFTLFVYYGLYQINGGITNLYLIVVFLFAVMIYYRFYLSVMQTPFLWFRRLLQPLWKKLTLAKKKILGIINIRRKKKKTKAEPKEGCTWRAQKKAQETERNKSNVTR